jgi:hypothetical protein
VRSVPLYMRVCVFVCVCYIFIIYIYNIYIYIGGGRPYDHLHLAETSLLN